MQGNPAKNDLAAANMAALLVARAAQFPERLAFVFEDESGATLEWSYEELHGRAQAVAQWLCKRAEPGDRALLVYPAGLDFIAAFFGCLYAGVLPVPATYPKPRRPLPRLDTIAADCEPKLALTHSSVLNGLCLDQQSPQVASLIWEATDQLSLAAGEQFQPVDRQLSDLAFLQYTSGSTSEPRGVMISHENLLHNLETIRVGFQMPAVEEGKPPLSGVFWLPAYHDMGLIGGILTPIYVGGTSYLLAPTTFLRRPLRWLELMSDKRAHISGAPNFGYELLVEKTTPAQRASLDLSQWQVAFCGAEPIHPATLDAFAEAFAPSGFRASAFYPCYGMAEVTLLVTGGRGPAPPQVLSVDREELRKHRAVEVDSSQQQSQPLVGCGWTLNGQRVEIVEPKARQLCGEGQVGEIWVQGRSVARGYWNRDEVNRETFAAQLNDNQQEGFLRTGDLGFRRDGQLYVTGRLKDVIIIRGRNHYPHDIERTAAAVHEAVGMGAAFSVEGQRGEQLVLVLQVNREHRKADFDEVIRSVRAAVVEEHELDPQAIVLIKPASLPITSSGKVQRQRCAEMYLAGQLQVLAEWQAAQHSESAQAVELPPPDILALLAKADRGQLQSEISQWLVQWLTARADLLPGAMQSDTPFAELGIDSLTAVEISQELDQLLELQLPPMVIWSCPNCEALAEYLAEALATQHAAGNDAARAG